MRLPTGGDVGRLSAVSRLGRRTRYGWLFAGLLAGSWPGSAQQAEPPEAAPQSLYVSVEDAERATWQYLRRIRAHAGIPGTMDASTPSPDDTDPWCPVVVDHGARQTLTRSLLHQDSVFDKPPRRTVTQPLASDREVRGGAKRMLPLSNADLAPESASTINDVADEPHRVPLFPSMSDGFRQGLVRVINHANRRGTVRIVAIDDAGERHGTATLSVGPDQVVHFNSDDLDEGNPGMGLGGGVGATDGDWRLELASELDIEVLSYIRTRDGFLTAMHDVVEERDGHHRVAIFNPGSNRDQVSQLRLVNLGTAQAMVSIRSTDDAGIVSAAVRTVLPAMASRTFTAADLESGGQGLEGSLGDGTGK